MLNHANASIFVYINVVTNPKSVHPLNCQHLFIFDEGLDSALPSNFLSRGAVLMYFLLLLGGAEMTLLRAL